ncbi:hypothetical protein SAMN04490179_3653 [Pseudomonas antarctica]|uniref:Uncharacterized protein n=1 Tax=Pseudomonas antarctica TaxID=219572 RepID=A0A1H0AHC3_9PSED|nr:hypothetical protein PSAN_42040 [Pseudomonas antarctica]SDN32176.1 hypothetical protein SAMN04490179_3653 [Pseudomonas antarctica]
MSIKSPSQCCAGLVFHIKRDSQKPGQPAAELQLGALFFQLLALQFVGTFEARPLSVLSQRK